MTAYFNDFLITLLGISLTMSAATALLMLLRRPMKKYFKAGSRFVIWALVMLRLCIPVGGILLPCAVNIADISKSSSYIEEDFSYEAPEGQKPDDLIPEIESPPIRDDADVSVQYTGDEPCEENSSAVENSFEITANIVSMAVFAVWSTGAFTFILKYTLQYNLSARYIKNNSREPDSSMEALFSVICSEMKLNKCPRLVISEAVDSPMLYGYFKPTVVMPSACFTEEAARGILSHELTHYKRGDLYLKLIAMIGNAIHWFNPLAYIASKLFAREMELSCDEKVLMLYDEEMRVNYGRIMLDIVANCRKSDAPLTTGFNPRANAVKERITNILDSHKKHKGSAFVSMTLIVCISAGSLLGYNVSAYDSSALRENMTSDDKFEADTVFANDTKMLAEAESESTPKESTAPDTAEISMSEESQTETPESTENTDDDHGKDTTPVSENVTGSSAAEPAEDTQTVRTGSSQINSVSVTSAADDSGTAATITLNQPHVHSYSVVKTAATCVQDGMNVYKCSCGDSYKTVIYKTHKHNTRHEERTVTSDGEQITYFAEVCTVCGIEIGYKKNIWDGTTISYYVSGPFYYDGEYNRDGELVVYGSGDMSNYCSLDMLFAEYIDDEISANGDLPPWWLYSSEYDSIVVAEGITAISPNAFSYCCQYVNTVTVGKTVKSIGKNAFALGTDIKTLYLPTSLESISANAFPDSTDVHIKYEGSAEEFAKLELGNLSYASVEFNVEY